MSAESELLIKIRTILESQGLDAAKQKLNDLTTASQTNSASQGVASAEMNKASRAAFALRMAANGSTEGLRGLSNAAFTMGQTLGTVVTRLTMVFAAFSAGWAIGDKIRSTFIDPLLEVKKTTDEVGKSVLDSATNFKALNQITFNELTTRLTNIISNMEKMNSSMTTAFSQDWAIADAKMEAKIAEITATVPEGSDRDKKIAEIRHDSAVHRFGDENRLYRSNINTADSAKNNAGFATSSAQIVRDEASQRYQDAAKSAGLAHGEGSTEYLKAIRKYADALTDAETALKTAKEKEAEITDQSNAIIRQETTKRTVAMAKMDAADANYKTELNRIEKAEIDKKKTSEAELRSAKLESLRREFETVTDPKQLSTLSEQMQSLQIEGISETNPEAIELRKGSISSESQTALQKRTQQVAISIAEHRLEREKSESYAKPADKKESADVLKAEQDLRQVKDGNKEAINRILNLIQELRQDSTEKSTRIFALEQREKTASGLA